MLNDRIRNADDSRLTAKIVEGVKPVHALCGFGQVTHGDRFGTAGGAYTEDVFDAILRHTRLVPREVIGIGGAIYDLGGVRGFDTVRKAVNSQASRNIAYAIEHSFLGWSDALHRRFAASLRQEVISGAAMADLAAPFGADGPRVIKFFVQHGLLGTAEPLPQRHRHYYQQRFSFDEVHGGEDSSSVNKDFFFIHPAFKEWIQSLPEQLNVPFERLVRGAVGDLKPYEARPPLMRLSLTDGRITLKLSTERRMLTLEKGTTSDSLKFLFVLLWACREYKETRMDIDRLKQVWGMLQKIDLLKSSLTVHLPTQADGLADKIRDWAKKINRDTDIRQLQKIIPVDTNQKFKNSRTPKKPLMGRPPFVSVSVSARR